VKRFNYYQTLLSDIFILYKDFEVKIFVGLFSIFFFDKSENNLKVQMIFAKNLSICSAYLKKKYFYILNPFLNKQV